MLLHINDLLFSLSRALDCVEQEIVGVTTNHSKRVALVSMRLCSHMGFNQVETFDMASCAVLHDNALTEYSLQQGRARVQSLKNVEFHCVSGEENARNFPFLGDTANIVLHHHENWDGSGFFRVKGKDIITRAAILRLADNADLLFGMSHGAKVMLHKVREHVLAGRGTLYAPEVADAFLDIANADFVHDLTNEHIDAALTRTLPVTPAEVVPLDLLNVCEIFSRITDAKSPFTHHHSRGVANKARLCAEAFGFAPSRVIEVTIAAHLHDVGKLSTPPSILEKPAALTPAEYDIMRNHVRVTEELLSPVRGLEDVSRWAASHHERMDGSGYHRALSAGDLEPECRLLACVDVYQALVEDRPYRVGMPHKKAMDIMGSMVDKGTMDPEMTRLVDAALADSIEPTQGTLPQGTISPSSLLT